MYDGAARRLLAGGPLYDLSFTAPGPNGLFDYPPTFILAVLPFARLMSASTAAVAWIAMLVGVFLLGVALLPVRRDVRWAIVLLAGLSWPFLYAVKLGQVAPLLFLAYAAAWRWADDPPGRGAAAALGTAAKLQPALLFGWALVTRRYRAVAAGPRDPARGGGSCGSDRRPGGVARLDRAHLAGRRKRDNRARRAQPGRHRVPRRGAAAARDHHPVGERGRRRGDHAVRVATAAADVGIVVTAVASVLVSPIVWGHYAVIILLPVALLLERRQWWAVAILPALWLPIDVVYPIAFVVGLVAPLSARGLLSGPAPDPGSSQPVRVERPGPDPGLPIVSHPRTHLGLD